MLDVVLVLVAISGHGRLPARFRRPGDLVSRSGTGCHGRCALPPSLLRRAGLQRRDGRVGRDRRPGGQRTPRSGPGPGAGHPAQRRPAGGLVRRLDQVVGALLGIAGCWWDCGSCCPRWPMCGLDVRAGPWLGDRPGGQRPSLTPGHAAGAAAARGGQPFPGSSMPSGRRRTPAWCPGQRAFRCPRHVGGGLDREDRGRGLQPDPGGAGSSWPTTWW